MYYAACMKIAKMCRFCLLRTLPRNVFCALHLSICRSVCPRGDKRFFLVDPEGEQQTFVTPRVYWFNDMDYHGVEADPWFRYSIRVDGKLDPAFVNKLSREARAR